MLKTKLIVRSVLLLAATLVGFVGVAPFSTSVYAAENVTDPVQQECFDVVPRRAQGACAGSDNANVRHARNVASYHCDDEASTTDLWAACIERKAKGYIREAADKNPRNVRDFTDDLDRILGNEGGSLNQPRAYKTAQSRGGFTCAEGKCIDPAADPDVDCEDRCDFIKKYINPGINLLTVAFGLIAVISLIMGGIQYASSTGDPQKVTSAKSRIMNTVVAIVAYFFLYGFLQFLIPGGLFNRS